MIVAYTGTATCVYRTAGIIISNMWQCRITLRQINCLCITTIDANPLKVQCVTYIGFYIAPWFGKPGSASVYNTLYKASFIISWLMTNVHCLESLCFYWLCSLDTVGEFSRLVRVHAYSNDGDVRESMDSSLLGNGCCVGALNQSFWTINALERHRLMLPPWV